MAMTVEIKGNKLCIEIDLSSPLLRPTSHPVHLPPEHIATYTVTPVC